MSFVLSASKETKRKPQRQLDGSIHGATSSITPFATAFGIAIQIHQLSYHGKTPPDDAQKKSSQSHRKKSR
jgi:hypothetical protein